MDWQGLVSLGLLVPIFQTIRRVGQFEEKVANLESDIADIKSDLKDIYRHLLGDRKG